MTAAPTGMDALIAAAKKEGQLTVIALPHDWVNYGEMISTFEKKYGIRINELNPDGSSGEELQSIKANEGNKGPQAPDVIDVGLAFGPQAKAAGLLAPYKVSTWNTIPDSVKDADGYWYGDYYGVLAFEVNTSVVKNVPKDWSDLLKPEYKGKIALAGDPRTATQAILTVAAAALANGGSFDNAAPGLQFFNKLNREGNFVPVIAVPGTIASGETPITIRWDYNALANRDKTAGNPPIDVVVPQSGVLAGVYVQGISAYAPHPNAAKLWEEFLYSDEGQLIWLKGYGHPARFNDLASRKLIPAELAAKLPPAEAYAKAVFPTLAQEEAAQKYIVANWDSVVNVNVAKQ
ncbi:MAG TPA: extracellular solute-binding protein [Spirochaetia bacterium]|nr:extracellular solute-binding protein [Spirochaetia bacterium]